MRIEYDRKVFSTNDKLAAEVRGKLNARGALALNLLGSPGSGKTSLVEKTAHWSHRAGVSAAALTGDQATRNDADRILASGIPAIQITTGDECHLNAQRILTCLGERELDDVRLLLIENVGNLICPAAYDLGEDKKVVILSVPEGDDKPSKYPGLFKRADLVVISKIDLVGQCDFDLERAATNVLALAPHVDVIRLSCRTGEGLEAWYRWLEQRLEEKPPRAARRRRPSGRDVVLSS
jgi:hydrogenase nickel incorporation protein HypB